MAWPPKRAERGPRNERIWGAGAGEICRQAQSPPREEGWLRRPEEKCREATLFGADGVVTHKPCSKNAFRNVARKRPPRPLEKGGFAAFFVLAATLLTKEGTMPA